MRPSELYKAQLGIQPMYCFKKGDIIDFYGDTLILLKSPKLHSRYEILSDYTLGTIKRWGKTVYTYTADYKLLTEDQSGEKGRIFKDCEYPIKNMLYKKVE